MDPKLHEEDETRKYVSTPQSARLSDYQLGRHDVEERREKDAEIGITYGPDENPFHEHSKNYSYTTEEEAPSPFSELLSKLRQAVNGYINSMEEHERAKAAAEIATISRHLMEQRGFVASEFFDEYKKIKEPYIEISVDRAEIDRRNRDKEELTRLRRFLESER